MGDMPPAGIQPTPANPKFSKEGGKTRKTVQNVHCKAYETDAGGELTIQGAFFNPLLARFHRLRAIEPRGKLWTL